MTDKSRDGFLIPTYEDTLAHSGGPDFLRLEEGRDYHLRFTPAFKIVQGHPKWFSQAKRHYSVPAQNTESGRIVFDCPQSVGQRCLPCEEEAWLREQGLWEGQYGIEPSTKYKFNVIDVNDPNAGVQILEDTWTLYSMLKLKQSRHGDLFDPFTGRVIYVQKLSSQPWRDVDLGDRMAIDEISEDLLEECKEGNLPDLDASWQFPDIEQQREWIGGSVREAVEANGDSQSQQEDEEFEFPPAMSGDDVDTSVSSDSDTEAAFEERLKAMHDEESESE